MNSADVRRCGERPIFAQHESVKRGTSARETSYFFNNQLMKLLCLDVCFMRDVPRKSKGNMGATTRTSAPCTMQAPYAAEAAPPQQQHTSTSPPNTAMCRRSFESENLQNEFGQNSFSWLASKGLHAHRSRNIGKLTSRTRNGNTGIDILLGLRSLLRSNFDCLARRRA